MIFLKESRLDLSTVRRFNGLILKRLRTYCSALAYSSIIRSQPVTLLEFAILLIRSCPGMSM